MFRMIIQIYCIPRWQKWLLTSHQEERPILTKSTFRSLWWLFFTPSSSSLSLRICTFCCARARMCPCHMRNIGNSGQSFVLILRRLRFWFTIQELCIRQLVVKGGWNWVEMRKKKECEKEKKKKWAEFWCSTSTFRRNGIYGSSIANSNQPITNGMDGWGEVFFFFPFLSFLFLCIIRR